MSSPLRSAVMIAVAGCASGCNALLDIDMPRSVDAAMEATDDSHEAASEAHTGDDEDAPAAFDAPTEQSESERESGRLGQVEFRGSSSASSRTDTLTIDAPPFIADTDLLWLTLYTDLASTDVPTPAGWIAQGHRTNPTNDFRTWWFYRFGGVGSHVVRLSQPTLSVATIVAYGGVDPATPFDSGTTADITGSPFVAPSVRPLRDGLLVVASFVNDSGGGSMWTPSPGMTTRIAFGYVFIADFSYRGGGETGPQSVTSSRDGAGAVAVVPLVPASR